MTANKPAAKATLRRVRVPIQQLAHAAGLPIPAYQTAGAAGLDLMAALPDNRPVLLAPGDRALIPTGLKFALPNGHEAQVRPRSGLALKHGVTVLNSPGTIDADYRGEVQVILVNLGQNAFEIRRGERIAQLVVQAVTQAELVVSDTLDDTARGAGGFGSTGQTMAPGKAVAAKKIAVPASSARADPKAKKSGPKRNAIRR